MMIMVKSLTSLALAALALAACSPAAEAAPPPLPRPMPEVVRAPCPGLDDAAGCHIGAGQADPAGRTYERGAVFVAVPGRFARLHELGHAFDATMMDAGERERFSRILRLRDLLWTWSYEEGGALIQDPGTLAEKFADAYAACRLGLRVGSGRPWETGYGYYPTARQHRRACALVSAAARDLGAPVAPDGSR
jgi:hypothetical protein